MTVHQTGRKGSEWYRTSAFSQGCKHFFFHDFLYIINNKNYNWLQVSFLTYEKQYCWHSQLPDKGWATLYGEVGCAVVGDGLESKTEKLSGVPGTKFRVVENFS